MALLAALVGFTHMIAGFTNATLTDLMTSELDGGYTSRQATYDLRRLRRKQLIERLLGTHRYQLTPLGRQIAVPFTKAHGRLLAPAMATFNPRLPDDLVRRSPLATAWQQLECTLDEYVTAAMAAA